MNNDQHHSMYDASAQSYRREAMADPSQPMPDDIDVQAEQQAREENIQGQHNLTANSGRTLKTLKLGGMLALFVAALVGTGYYLYWPSDDSANAQEKTREGYTTSKMHVQKLGYDKLKEPEPTPVESEPLTAPEPEPSQPLRRPVLEDSKPEPVQVYVERQPNQIVPQEPSVPQGPTLADLQRAAPMMGNANGNGMDKATQMAGKVQQGISQPASSFAPDLGEAGEKFTQLLTGTKTEAAQVKRMKNRHLTIEKGTFIDCILETRLDTTVPGMTACIIPQNVYSMNGKSLLIEKGSRALGEYRGSVQNGLERIFVLWTEVRTPNGMIVKLDSPATDALGGAGASGYVDHHWWKRFGNALLFSIISDGFDFATTKVNEGSNNNYYTNTSDNMTALIEEAMQQAGNIPPTLTKNQGERMGIFVGRDIDFSSVYELEASE